MCYDPIINIEKDDKNKQFVMILKHGSKEHQKRSRPWGLSAAIDE